VEYNKVMDKYNLRSLYYDRKKEERPKKSMGPEIATLITGFVFLLCLAGLVLLGLYEAPAGVILFVTMLTFLLFFGGLASVFWMMKQSADHPEKENRDLEEWKAFAARNSLVFHEADDESDVKARVGYIDIAENVRMVDPCTETTVERDGDTTRISTVGGSTEVRFRLPRKVPHIIIRPTGYGSGFNTGKYEFREIAGGVSPGMREALMDVKTIKLEGDFGRIFDVKIPEGYHIDVLQLLTPDVMSAMLLRGDEYHYMLYEDTFTVMTDSIGSPKNLEEHLMNMQVIANHILHQARSYSDARVGDREANMVQVKGKELKQSKKIKVFQVTFISIYIGMFLLAIGGGNLVIGGIPLMFVGMYGVVGMLGGLLLLGLAGEVIKKGKRSKYKSDIKRREKSRH